MSLLVYLGVFSVHRSHERTERTSAEEKAAVQVRTVQRPLERSQGNGVLSHRRSNSQMWEPVIEGKLEIK